MQNINVKLFERWLKNLGEGELVPHEVVVWVESSLNGVYDHIEDFLRTDLLPRLNTLMGGMGSSIKSVLGVLADLALGIIISAYILGERKVFKRQILLILRAAFSEKTVNWILKEASFANQKFNGFLIGKIVEAKERTFMIEIAGDVVVEVARNAVQGPVEEDKPADGSAK